MRGPQGLFFLNTISMYSRRLRMKSLILFTVKLSSTSPSIQVGMP